jgi:hypothetical protein
MDHQGRYGVIYARLLGSGTCGQVKKYDLTSVPDKFSDLLEIEDQEDRA